MSERPLEGAAAPPMTNGELDFEAPWQGRVFAMANALCEAGLFEWSEFQQSLIDEIASHERDDRAYAYYERFQAALENLVQRKALVGAEQIEHRTQAFAERPHGHDHSH